MAQSPNLDNAPLNLTALRDQSQKDLLNILKSVRGKKCLVIDPMLAGTLSLIWQTSLLKEYGVELRILSADLLQTECLKIVYLVRSQLNFMKFIASQIKNDKPKGLQREYFLYFVPRRTVTCEKILEEEKVHQKLTIGEYPLYLVPLDESAYFSSQGQLDTASEKLQNLINADPRDFRPHLCQANSFCSSSPFFLHSTKANRMKTLRRKLDLLAKDSVIFSLTQDSTCELEQSDNQEEFDTVSDIRSFVCS